MLADGRLFYCKIEQVVMEEGDNITVEKIQEYVDTTSDQILEVVS
jgi:hypothetical protein